MPAELARAAAVDPELPWLRFLDGDTHTLAELHQRVRSVGAGLQAWGIRHGDRVAIMAGNSIEFVETWFAVQLVGAIAVPINTALRGEVLTHMLDLAGPSVTVVEDSLCERLLDAAGGNGGLGTVAVVPTGNAEPARTDGARAAIPYSALRVDEDPVPVAVDERDAASIMYTSGTTGPSKGTVWTHGSTWHMAEIPRQAMGYGPDDVLYVCLPLFHASALANLLLSGLLGRSRIVVASRFSVSGFWSDALESGATATNILGAMGPLLLARDPSPEERGHSLRTAMVVPAAAGTRDAMRDRFGLEIVHPYGLSDFGWVCWPDHGEPVPEGSVGRVHPSFEARIVDEHDHEVPHGQAGELVARPTLPWTTSPGYWRMPEQTAEARRNLWFHTGDLLSRDEEGYFYFHDRSKDAMRRRGENVSSFEVERAIAGHPAVFECAAYALPSDLTEDEIAIAVVLREGVPEPTPEEIVGFVTPRLPYFAVPRYVRFLRELPKTQTEKVQKHELRATGITPQTWDAEKGG